MEKFDDKNSKIVNTKQDSNENKSGNCKSKEHYKNNYRDNRKYENKSFNRYNYPDGNFINNFDRNDKDIYRSSNHSRYSWIRNKRNEETRTRSYSPLKSRKKNYYYSHNNSNINKNYQHNKNDNFPTRLNQSKSPYKSSKNNKQQTNKKKIFNKFHQTNNNNNNNFDKNKTNKLEINNEKNTKNEITKLKTPSRKRKQNIYKIIENNRKKNDENILKNSKEFTKNTINDNNLEIINQNIDISNKNHDNLNNTNTNIDTIITPKISLVPLSQLLREELASHFDEITKEISAANNQQTNIINNDFELLTDKLLNKVVKMDKINIKNIINNPSAKFDAALKFRASQRFRDEIRKQLRAIQIENPDLNKCNDFESDNFVNDSNIPQLILDQIQQSLGIEFLQQIANETTITTPDITLSPETNEIATTNDNSTINNDIRSPIVIEDQILPNTELPETIESKLINQSSSGDEQNIELSKPDLLQKLKNLDNLKMSTKRINSSTSSQKCNNTSPIKDTSKSPIKINKSSPKINKLSPKILNNNNNRKKLSIKNNSNNNNNEILTISSTSSSSSSSSSSDSDSSSTSSSTNSSVNSTTYKKNNRYHRKDKEIEVVERFKKLILPTLSLYLRKKYNDKYSKNLTNSLSFIYDICLNKLMKNSNLGSYEKKVLKKNLKSNNNDGALEYLLKNIEELHEQNIKYKRKLNQNQNNNNNSKNTEKSLIIDLNSSKKIINKQNQIKKNNSITKNQQNDIDNSVIEAAVQNSEFIASQLKKIAQKKIDERNKEKLNIQQKNLQISTSSSTASSSSTSTSSSSTTTTKTPNLDTSNPNQISSIKNNLINEQPKLTAASNDNNCDENHKNSKILTQNCDKNVELCPIDKPIAANSAENQQSISKELIQNEFNKFEVVKSNILPTSSKYQNVNNDDGNINDKTNNNNNKKNHLIEKNPVEKINPVKEIELNLVNENQKLNDNMIISNIPLENNIVDNNYTTDEDENDENLENTDQYDENNSNNKQRSWKSPGEKKCVTTPTNNKRKNSETLLLLEEKNSSSEMMENSNDNNNKIISNEIDNLQKTALIQQNKISDAVLSNLKELDLRLLELHKRKMYVEEMILKLQKDNMAIDLARMQLQNERFLIINSALAKGNISLTTNQLLSSIQGQSTNLLLDNVLIKTEPLSSDWHQSYKNGISVCDYVSSMFPSSNNLSSSNTNSNNNTNKRKIVNNSPSKIPFSTPFSEKLRNRKKRSEHDILLEDTENILRNSQDNLDFEIESNTTEISSENNNIPLVKKSERIKNNTKIQNKITESLKLTQSPKKKIKLSVENIKSNSNTKSENTNNNNSSEIELQTLINDCVDNESDENVDTSNIENGSFEGFKLPITQIRIIGDSIIVSSEDGNIYKYCWHTKELLAKFTKHTEAVIQFFLDSNGFIYSISLDGYLKKTSCENFGLEMQSVNLQEPLQSIDIQWNLAFVGSRWGNIFVYNIKDNKLSETLLYSVGSSIMALKATKEETRKVLIIASKGNQINIIDATSGLQLRIVNVPVNYNIYSILLCGNIIFCGSNKNEILSYNFTNGEKIGTMICGNGAISMKMFKNKQIFVGCYDGFVYVLDKNTGYQIGRFPGSGNIITALDIIGEKILTAAKDNSLKLTDIPNYVLALDK